MKYIAYEKEMKMKILSLIEKYLPNIDYKNSDDDLTFYGKDSLSLYKPIPSVILFPKSTKEVIEIVKFANKERIPLVPSGGRTGLSGGATAINNEIVVSLEKLNRIVEFFPEEQTVEVEAGLITKHLQDFAKSKNLYFPIDYVAVGSSQIGGNISTNAGGIHVIRYGMMRNWVVGLSVVTGTGELLELNKALDKNNTGLDLRHLMIGSEGILGIITKATIKLTKTPDNIKTYFVGINNLEQLKSFSKWIRNNIDIHAFEFFTDSSLDYALSEKTFKYAFNKRYNYYAIFEFENRNSIKNELSPQEFENWIIEELANKQLIADGIISFSSFERENIWKHRELIPVALNKLSPYKNDISIRLSLLFNFINDLELLFLNNYIDLKIVWFGHLGDGNLHINIPKPHNLNVESFKNKCDLVSNDIYSLIKKYNGSISAEHGVGIIKKEFLNYTRSQGEINIIKSIKKLFDPNNILNPGKVV